MRIFILTRTNSDGDVTSYIDRSSGAAITVHNFVKYPTSYHRCVQLNVKQLNLAIGAGSKQQKKPDLEAYFDTVFEHIKVLALDGDNTLTKDEIKAIKKYISKKKNENNVNENRIFVVEFGDGTFMDASYSGWDIFYKGSSTDPASSSKHSMVGIKSGLTRTIRDYGKDPMSIDEWTRKRFLEHKPNLPGKLKNMKIHDASGKNFKPVDAKIQAEFDEYIKEIDNRLLAATMGMMKV